MASAVAVDHADRHRGILGPRREAVDHKARRVQIGFFEVLGIGEKFLQGHDCGQRRRFFIWEGLVLPGLAVVHMASRLPGALPGNSRDLPK